MGWANLAPGPFKSTLTADGSLSVSNYRDGQVRDDLCQSLSFGQRYVGDHSCWSIPIFPVLDLPPSFIETNSWKFWTTHYDNPTMLFLPVVSDKLKFSYVISLAEHSEMKIYFWERMRLMYTQKGVSGWCRGWWRGMPKKTKCESSKSWTLHWILIREQLYVAYWTRTCDLHSRNIGKPCKKKRRKHQNWMLRLWMWMLIRWLHDYLVFTFWPRPWQGVYHDLGRSSCISESSRLCPSQ